MILKKYDKTANFNKESNTTQIADSKTGLTKPGVSLNA